MLYHHQDSPQFLANVPGETVLVKDSGWWPSTCHRQNHTKLAGRHPHRNLCTPMSLENWCTIHNNVGQLLWGYHWLYTQNRGAFQGLDYSFLALLGVTRFSRTWRSSNGWLAFKYYDWTDIHDSPSRDIFWFQHCYIIKSDCAIYIIMHWF